MVGSKTLGKNTCVRSYSDILKKLVLKQSLLGLSMSQGIIEEVLRIRGMQEFIGGGGGRKCTVVIEESTVQYRVFLKSLVLAEKLHYICINKHYFLRIQMWFMGKSNSDMLLNI